MSYVRNWLHCVWGTKSRYPFLTPDVKCELIDHIRQNAKTKSIHIDCIDGDVDQIHCLVSLHPDQSLSKVMQLIKGESSFWVNKTDTVGSDKFEWADEYFAVSVSESQLQKVRNYIANQEEHHRKKQWQEEYDEFVALYGFRIIKG